MEWENLVWGPVLLRNEFATSWGHLCAITAALEAIDGVHDCSQ